MSRTALCGVVQLNIRVCGLGKCRDDRSQYCDPRRPRQVQALSATVRRDSHMSIGGPTNNNRTNHRREAK